MSPDLFDSLEQTLRSQGADAGFDWLAERLREEKKYPLVFEVLLMRQRHALGLPLVSSANISDLPPEHQQAYAAALREAARETGALFLADGDIPRAWPYFRAAGDPAPVAQAIEQLPASEATEPVLQIALNERVHPRKGFEFLIAQHGVCAAIGVAAEYPDRDDRLAFLEQIVRAITRELAAALREAIAGVEGQAPESDSVAALLAGRDWLFAGGRCYTDNSHLAAIVQASPELHDRESLRLAWELTAYGRRLDPAHQFPSNPPFADTYTAFGAYLGALLGEESEAGLAYFRQQLDDSVPGSAEILVGLLARTGRYREALALSLQHLGGEGGSACPSAVQLCQMAGDFAQLRALARQEGDLLAFAAGVLQR